MNISNSNSTTREAGTDSTISTGTSTSESCKEGASKLSDDGVCSMNNMLNNMDIGVAVSICANCGKEGDDVNNICNKCKQMRYCNAVCKKVHKKKHKRDCEEYIRLAAEKHNDELRLAAELHDKELFKEPPPADDCPICFNRIPRLETGWRYYACCGKVICSGCSYAPVYDNQGNEVDNDKQNECPFCRVVAPKSEKEIVERLNKRVEAGDAEAIYTHGNYYKDGKRGFPQDYIKALELWHRAAELGNITAYSRIGYAYDNGQGVEIDFKKAYYYYELAAMGGCAVARHNLGIKEMKAFNEVRALKHFLEKWT